VVISKALASSPPDAKMFVYPMFSYAKIKVSNKVLNHFTFTLNEKKVKGKDRLGKVRLNKKIIDQVDGKSCEPVPIFLTVLKLQSIKNKNF